MADLSYVKGRLEGLFELVTLLKDLVHGDVEGSAEMLQKMVDHIYVELGEILDVLGSSAPATAKKADSVVSVVKKEAKQPSTGVKAKDVLSELLTKPDE